MFVYVSRVGSSYTDSLPSMEGDLHSNFYESEITKKQTDNHERLLKIYFIKTFFFLMGFYIW